MKLTSAACSKQSGRFPAAGRTTPHQRWGDLSAALHCLYYWSELRWTTPERTAGETRARKTHWGEGKAHNQWKKLINIIGVTIKSAGNDTCCEDGWLQYIFPQYVSSLLLSADFRSCTDLYADREQSSTTYMQMTAAAINPLYAHKQVHQVLRAKSVATRQQRGAGAPTHYSHTKKKKIRLIHF